MSNHKNTSLRYMQVYLDLKDKIVNGDYPQGAQIPVEKALLGEYQVSITTLRRAIELLCADGLLAKKQGCGTFVNGAAAVAPTVAARPPAELSGRLRLAVLMPDVSRMTPEGDARHWQLNLRRIDGIYQEASRLGCSVSIFDLSEDFDLAAFDGAIIFRVFEIEQEAVFARLVRPLEAANKPYVVISEYDLRFAAKYWIVENLELEFLNAYRYLARMGMRRLIVIGPNLTPRNPRIGVLKYVLPEKDILLLENTPSDTASAREVMRGLLAKRGRLGDYDTIFCTTDLQAVGVMEALLERGIRIPGDVNLMGCDNISDGVNAPVPLTTFQFSGRGVGRIAMELAVRAVAGDYPDGLVSSKRGRIIERDSVRKISRN